MRRFCFIILLALLLVSSVPVASQRVVRRPITSAAGGGNCDPTAYTGATAWYDATATSLPGLADGGAVGSSTNWLDRITGTRNFSQGNSANRPILHTTGGPNTQPYIQFADSTDNVEYSSGFHQVYNATALTGFAVIRPQRDGQNASPEFCPMVFGNFNGYVGVSLRNTGSGNKFVFYIWDGGYDTVTSTTTFAQNTWYIVEWWFDGSTMGIKVNNDTAVTTAQGSIDNLVENPNIGQGGLTSDMGGLYLWNADIGSTNRGAFRTCLGDRFGITLP